MKLHLGEIVYPYTGNGADTGKVAEILEAKYGVMQKFVDLNEEEIAHMIEEGVAAELENIAAGARLGTNSFSGMTEKIERKFRAYIDEEGHGIATKAKSSPVAGSRKKRQYRKAKGKTTFVDTGAYYRNFKAWVE